MNISESRGSDLFDPRQREPKDGIILSGSLIEWGANPIFAARLANEPERSFKTGEVGEWLKPPVC